MALIDPNLPAIGVAIVLAVLAASSDWHSRRIPNALILVGIVTATGLALLSGGVDGLMFSLSGAAVGFILQLPGFLLRFTGAGDVKLLTMLGAFLGPSLTLLVFIVSVGAATTFVIFRGLARTRGAGLAAHARRYAQMFHSFFATGRFVYAAAPATSVLRQRLPMAPFVAFALVVAVSYRYLQLSGGH